jgi:hypothetical protein
MKVFPSCGVKNTVITKIGKGKIMQPFKWQKNEL